MHGGPCSLPTLVPQKLECEGGFFGWVLRLVQQRGTRPDEFQHLLKRVVQHLEAMPSSQRFRWLEFLSYLHALVYHERNPAERRELQKTIETSVRTAEHRQEVKAMKKTIADVIKEEGRREEAIRARRQTLLRQLRKRFSDLPTETVNHIRRCHDVHQLDAWLDRIVDVETLNDMEIGPTAP